jgi:hypothetical protein
MEELEDEFNELSNELLTEWIKEANASFFYFFIFLKILFFSLLPKLLPK